MAADIDIIRYTNWNSIPHVRIKCRIEIGIFCYLKKMYMAHFNSSNTGGSEKVFLVAVSQCKGTSVAYE